MSDPGDRLRIVVTPVVMYEVRTRSTKPVFGQEAIPAEVVELTKCLEYCPTVTNNSHGAMTELRAAIKANEISLDLARLSPFFDGLDFNPARRRSKRTAPQPRQLPPSASEPGATSNKG